MNILFLGYKDSPLIKFLEECGEIVIESDEKIDVPLIRDKKIDFIISYCYKHIIKKEVINFVPNKIINLHISFLPWNKGTDPNFWSIVDDTPKGVTIHYVDEGIDTGDILLQKPVEVSENETLRTSFNKLHQEIQKLFIQNWQDLRAQKITAKKQPVGGSFHKYKDKEKYISQISDKWLDMEIQSLIDYISEIQMSQQFWEKYYSEIMEMKSQNKSLIDNR